MRIKSQPCQLVPCSRPSRIPFADSIKRRKIPHAGIARCLRFMVTKHHKPIRVSDVQKLSGLSRRGFVKAFRRDTGYTPGQLLIQLRIDLAKRILTEQEITLAELTTACGFRRKNSFFVTFRRQVGLAPMEFRRRMDEAAVNRTKRFSEDTRYRKLVIG